jgi:hypothetical protein
MHFVSVLYVAISVAAADARLIVPRVLVSARVHHRDAWNPTTTATPSSVRDLLPRANLEARLARMEVRPTVNFIMSPEAEASDAPPPLAIKTLHHHRYS